MEFPGRAFLERVAPPTVSSTSTSPAASLASSEGPYFGPIGPVSLYHDIGRPLLVIPLFGSVLAFSNRTYVHFTRYRTEWSELSRRRTVNTEVKSGP